MAKEYTNEEKMDEPISQGPMKELGDMQSSIESGIGTKISGILPITQGGTGSNNGSIRGSGTITITSTGGTVDVQGESDINGTGQDINLTAGNGKATAGDINVTAGNANAGNGGSLVITAGSGGSTFLGGEIDIIGGSGGATGPGGDIRITAGDAGGGTNIGGKINLTPGNSAGGGAKGRVYITDSNSGIVAILDTDSLATSDKTFTFPNTTGTFALLSAVNGTFVTADIPPKTVTVTNGIITSMV